jgi:hypothetical protein
MCGKWWMNVCNYSEVMDICGLSNFKNVTRWHLLLELEKKMSNAFMDCLKIYWEKERNSKNNLVLYFKSTIGQDGSLSTRKQCGVYLIYSSKYIYACWYEGCKKRLRWWLCVFCWLIERSWKNENKIFYCFRCYFIFFLQADYNCALHG